MPQAALAGGARLRFVLVETSHAGNIGASARALRAMGFARLCVVQPRDAQFREAPEARALATSSLPVLEAARAYASLAEALEGVQLAFATTGYAREWGPAPLDVRVAAARAAAVALPLPARPATADSSAPAGAGADALAGSGEVAFVFGPERTGLSNADVQRCHACCSIPTDAQCNSLNLAQAVQVVAYEVRRALLERAGVQDQPSPRRDHTQPAPRELDPLAGIEQTEALFAHLEQGLVAVGYLDPEEPRHLMARLRRLLLRAQPTLAEVDILRGVAAAMVLPRRLRAGRKQQQ